MLKLILSVLLLSSFLSLISCAGLPPDEPLCTEINPERAYCVRMMSGKQFEISETKKFNGQTWWELKPTVISMPASTWRELKKWIIKICKNNSQCDDAVAGWDRTVKIIDDQVSSKE